MHPLSFPEVVHGPRNSPVVVILPGCNKKLKIFITQLKFAYLFSYICIFITMKTVLDNDLNLFVSFFFQRSKLNVFFLLFFFNLFFYNANCTYT